MHARVSARIMAQHERSRSAPAALRPILVVAFLLISGVFAYTALRSGHHGDPRPWLYAIAIAGLFVARGLHLNRPVTLAHSTIALLLVALAEFGYRAEHPHAGFAMLSASGAVLMLPVRSRPEPQSMYRVSALVDRTVLDPLAPFALHSMKSYYFNDAGTAAIAYHARAGMAVVSGDPIGDEAAFENVIAEFCAFARSRGWRVTVLGAGERCLKTWQVSATPPLRQVPIGRDVVIDVANFNLDGRKFRNLRQAVSRTHNFGVTTEILSEHALSEETRDELLAVVDQWKSGRQTRGFSMILDHLLDGRNPGMLVVIARDIEGRVVGFQRYGSSARGRELTIDVPWRAKHAPNGIDERMIVDLVEYGKSQGVQRISLAFAAFPELFTDTDRSFGSRVCYRLVHFGDPLLNLESLYRFLRKFHALGEQRFVLVRLRELVPAAFALLTLEFVPHRRQH
ncbi:DUF2156 domain-containing protein [Skermania sp. ID1734]|uniref:bifunctional lysylphosphatidylglycerol flippase/synthetase MprF n=1 Tax=Skermania sp. ID1734 TaxID=2597516 RepID=UPI001181292F|nr:phosphatidylglycerol lysyltransferase domain-containing protein [Skermania sp. ID1734]TSE01904.1 DUF2156 domain-containing protein [Skermania sp. ID1734]